MPHSTAHVHVARTVRKLRLKMKLSQERLAELAGLHTNTVRRLESVKYDPALSTLLKLARALKVRPAALLKDIR